MVAPRVVLGAGALAALAASGAYAWYRWTPEVWSAHHLQEAASLASTKPDAAREHLQAILERFPRRQDARWQLIQLELQRGRMEHAYLHLMAYTELFPEDPQGWMLVARLMNDGGPPEVTEAALDRAIKAATEPVDALALRARIRYRRGRMFGARVDAQALIAKAPSRAAEFERLLADTRRALVPAPDPARLRISDVNAHQLIAEGGSMIVPGGLAEVRREFNEAVHAKNWGTALAIADRAKKTYAGTMFGDWLAGTAELAQQHFDAAEKRFRMALALAPRSSVVIDSLSNIWLKQKDSAYAGDQLMELVAADPGLAFARQVAARHYLNARWPDRAEGALRAATLGTNANADAFRDLALFYLELDRLNDALQACRDGLAHYPANVDLESLKAYIHTRAGEHTESRRLLEEIVLAHPDRQDDTLALLRLLSVANDAASQARSRQLLQDLENDGLAETDAADTVGWAWSQLGERARARPWLDAAVKAAPQRPAYAFHHAALIARMGLRSEAIDELNQALKSTAPFKEQPDAQKLLKELTRR